MDPPSPRLRRASGLNQLVWDAKSDSGQNSPPGQSSYTLTIFALAGSETAQASFDVTVLNKSGNLLKV